VFTDVPCPWERERDYGVFCYECHEELLHNPVLLRDDIARFAELVDARGLTEREKTEDRSKIAGRVQLLHEVIAAGLAALRREMPAHA